MGSHAFMWEHQTMLDAAIILNSLLYFVFTCFKQIWPHWQICDADPNYYYYKYAIKSLSVSSIFAEFRFVLLILNSHSQLECFTCWCAWATVKRQTVKPGWSSMYHNSLGLLKACVSFTANFYWIPSVTGTWNWECLQMDQWVFGLLTVHVSSAPSSHIRSQLYSYRMCF